MKSHRQITSELIGQEEIEMKTFQRYLSSINKGSIVEVLDLPAAVLDHLLAK